MNGENYTRDGGRHASSREYPATRSDRDERRDRDRGDRNRRRSRSPQDYRGSRQPRREAPGGVEADSYSSSRSHRDREREDRYSGRDRPEREREPWDRERGGGPRRDRDRPRRDDDERRGHRDGAASGAGAGPGAGAGADDRPRGDGRRERGGRDQERDRDRRRSVTPPPKKREPTPDLTDVVPILERKRRLTQWDMKPPGYNTVTAEQAKLSGMFPLPGAPRQQVVDPTKLQVFMPQPTPAPANSILRPANSRQSKRLFITNLPPSTTEDGLLSFLNLQLNGLNVIESADPCSQCQISQDTSFALVEFRTSSDATVALAFDGISMEADDADAGDDGAAAPAGGATGGLSIRRPKDYIVPVLVEETGYVPGVVSNVVVDTPHKLSIANIPSYLGDEQVTELLVSFGELKAFVLAKDRGTEESRGVAFCEYLDPATTDIALQGLDGMELGDKRLKVRKASLGITQVTGIELGVNAMTMLAGTLSMEPDISRVVQLLNMVTPDELLDNEEYEEICEDVKDECSKFGKIEELKVPRPAGGGRQAAGVGKIYIKFDTPENATKALRALAGRKFADRTVVATYFPEDNFDVNGW